MHILSPPNPKTPLPTSIIIYLVESPQNVAINWMLYPNNKNVANINMPSFMPILSIKYPAKAGKIIFGNE
jgi:hypothetical protein